MIILLVKCYLTILLYIGIGSICLFLIGSYVIIRKFYKKNLTNNSSFFGLNKKNEDHEQALAIAAISGDDMMATQLDLARAYIEADKQDMAKKMLLFIIAQGNALEKKEAQRLLGSI